MRKILGALGKPRSFRAVDICFIFLTRLDVKTCFMRENLSLSMFPSLKTITFPHGSAGVGGVGGVGVGVVHERDPPFSLMNAPFMRAALMK